MITKFQHLPHRKPMRDLVYDNIKKIKKPGLNPLVYFGHLAFPTRYIVGSLSELCQ